MFKNNQNASLLAGPVEQGRPLAECYKESDGVLWLLHPKYIIPTLSADRPRFSVMANDIPKRSRTSSNSEKSENSKRGVTFAFRSCFVQRDTH